MKVVCDNCGAVYKVPDDKLVKPVNKATCRQCGHRMLIPRPRADADPNERTLVTAVPPTPMGAPARDNYERGTSPIDDEPEKTLPGRAAPAGFNRRSLARDEVPVFPGTPLPAGPRNHTNTADALRAAGGDTVKSTNGQIPGGQGGLADSAPTPSRQPVHSAPPLPPPLSTRQPTPAPAYAAHDPSGDMSIAMVGVFGALAGIFILASLIVWPWRSVLWLGLTVSIGGAITSLLILITSGRGRRAAWLGVSIITGGLLAVALSTTIVSTHYVGNALVNMDPSQLDQLVNFTNPPVAPVEPTIPQPLPQPEVVGGDPEVVGGDPEPTEQPEPTEEPEQPKPTVASNPKPRPNPRPQPRPVAPTPRPVAPTPRPVAPAPVAPAPAAVPKAVSYEVIDVMLRNNMGVKRCFFDFIQSTGQRPPRVDVKFTLMPTGSVTGVSVKQTEYQGGPLEACLGSAIRAVAFPPSDGNGQKITYPFILQ